MYFTKKKLHVITKCNFVVQLLFFISPLVQWLVILERLLDIGIQIVGSINKGGDNVVI